MNQGSNTTNDPNNDGLFPDDALVLVRYPMTNNEQRGVWSWLPGTILSQCGADEWHVRIDVDALAELDMDGDRLYPCCFRDATELQLRGSVQPGRTKIAFSTAHTGALAG
jgi:hypothetical protein